MAFCPSCGAPVDGKFCGSCGAQVGAAPQAAPAAGTGLADNAASALCYLAGLITGILFLVLEPYSRNKTVRFHAFQSIFFSVAWLAFWIAVSIVSAALPAFASILIGLLSLVVWLGGFILWLLLMWKAYQNQKLVLPIIGPMAEKQA